MNYWIDPAEVVESAMEEPQNFIYIQIVGYYIAYFDVLTLWSRSIINFPCLHKCDYTEKQTVEAYNQEGVHQKVEVPHMFVPCFKVFLWEIETFLLKFDLIEVEFVYFAYQKEKDQGHNQLEGGVNGPYWACACKCFYCVSVIGDCFIVPLDFQVNYKRYVEKCTYPDSWLKNPIHVFCPQFDVLTGLLKGIIYRNLHPDVP